MLKKIEYKRYPILCVGRDAASLGDFRRQWENDFLIRTAQEEAEALEALKKEEVAVVVADQSLSPTGGLTFLGQVRSACPDAVRVLMDDEPERPAIVRAVGAREIYHCLGRPWDPREVRDVLRHAIDLHDLLKEREELYAEKLQTLRKIARANRLSAMGILAAGMAHEINNPLVSISTFLQMLPQKYAESAKDKAYWEELYAVAVREVERIRQLLQQLLSYSRGLEPGHFEPTSVNELLQEMVLFVENEARKKGVRVRREFGRDLPSGRMDRNRVKQVFLNLLLNAVQATEDKGEILVRSNQVREEGARLLQVEVSDTGVGISEENLEKLFTPFFTTKNSEGSGLGLLTCHHIVDEHRGSIEVRSELGRGTTFVVRLPVSPEDHERRKAVRREILEKNL